MPRRILVPLKFGSAVLLGKGRKAWLEYDSGGYDTPAHAPVLLSRVGRSPSLVRMQPGAKTLPLKITISSPDSEHQFESLSKAFNPLDGLQTLLVRDEKDNRRKRISCVPQQVIHEEVHDKALVVPLLAPDPYLEDDELTSDAQSLTPGSPAAFSPRNLGTIYALPTLSVEVGAAKYATGGYARMHEVVYANRSEFPLDGPASGTWLLDITDGGWDTAALVDVSAITETATTTVSSGQTMPFDITVGSTAGFDPEGLCLLDPGGGSEEQCEYVVKNATELTLTARALGGTAAATHTANYTVHQSRMLADGRDIAVWLDGVQVAARKVTVDDMDSASTKVWIEIADAPALTAVLAEDSASASTLLEFQEEHGFVVGDYITYTNDAPAQQVDRVTAVTEKTVTVVKAQRNTTQDDASAGITVYKVGHHIQVAWNYSKAEARPSNPDAPLIDTGTSTNAAWEWTTAPIWAAGNNAPGGWTRLLYPGRDNTPTLIKNRLAEKTVLDVNGSAIRFTDAEPTGAAPNFDSVEFKSPLGVDDVAGAVEYDADLGYPFVLQVIGRDLIGYDILLASKYGPDHSSLDEHTFPQSYADEQETPDSILQAIVFRARNAAVTLVSPTSSSFTMVERAVDDQRLQHFILDQDTHVRGVIIKAGEATSGSEEVGWQVSERRQSGAPGVPLIPLTSVWAYNPPSLTLVYVCGSAEAFSTFLLAGDYVLEVFDNAAGTGFVRVAGANGPAYSRGSRWSIVSGFWEEDLGQDIEFVILSDEVDNQEEVLSQARTGQTLELSNLRVEFDPDRTPIVDVQADEDAYHFRNEISRSGGESLELNYIKRWADITGQTLTIDIATRQVTDAISSYEDTPRVAIEGDDPWLTLPPGGSAITVDNASDAPASEAQDETWTLSFRSRWQA